MCDPVWFEDSQEKVTHHVARIAHNRFSRRRSGRARSRTLLSVLSFRFTLRVSKGSRDLVHIYSGPHCSSLCEYGLEKMSLFSLLYTIDSDVSPCVV